MAMSMCPYVSAMKAKMPKEAIGAVISSLPGSCPFMRGVSSTFLLIYTSMVPAIRVYLLTRVFDGGDVSFSEMSILLFHVYLLRPVVPIDPYNIFSLLSYSFHCY
jgi:hypothetical protein